MGKIKEKYLTFEKSFMKFWWYLLGYRPKLRYARVKSEKVMVGGEKLHRITRFYENGNVEYISHNKGDLPHGKYEWFYEDGRSETTCNYKEGLLHGKSEGIHSGYAWYFKEDKDITEEVVEFLEENPPKNGLYPAYVEGYFKLKYSLSLEQLGIDVEKEAC